MQRNGRENSQAIESCRPNVSAPLRVWVIQIKGRLCLLPDDAAIEATETED
jgi:hypothetical protein